MTEAIRPDGSDDPDPDRRSSAVESGDKSHSASGQETKIAWLRSVRRWAAEHKSETFWAFVFAALLAVPAAFFIEPPKPKPYKIAVIEDPKTDDNTKKMFANLASDRSPLPPLQVGHVPVQLENIMLPDDTEDTVRKEAQELANDQHTLVVIGHLRSALTESLLPVLMAARPQLPYISTTASDDNLLNHCPNCDGHFVPLLQLSPSNRDQADSAVRFATQRGKTRFLIVTEVDPEKDKDYVHSMDQDFYQAVYSYGAIVVGKYSMERPPSEQDEVLRESKPDCILYAGNAGAAETLLRSVEGRNLLVILSDAVIETRGNDENLAHLALARTGLVRFTYATDAADYDHSINRYGKDAVSITEQLLQDLNARGGDLSYRFRSLVHFESVNSARNNLVRIMEENAGYRTSYSCESSPASESCIFKSYRRQNGLFHVWQLGERDQPAMLDIDGWHPPRIPAK